MNEEVYMIEMLDLDEEGNPQYFPAGYVGKDDIAHLLRFNFSNEAKVLGKGHTVFRVKQLYKIDRACLKERFKQIIRRHDDGSYRDTEEGSTKECSTE